jgi:hypothetical protein
MKRPRRPNNPNVLAKRIVDMAAGEAARDSQVNPETPLTEIRRRSGLKGQKPRNARRQCDNYAPDWGRYSNHH